LIHFVLYLPNIFTIAIKMKALKYLFYFLLVIAALVIALGLFGKKDYHLERSLLIKAPHSIVKDKVTHWANFPKWSPWQPLDPKMITTITGQDGTVGSTYSWKGNDKVGSGSQTFKSITDNEVKIDVNFTEPWASSAPSSIKMEQSPDGVLTTWSFDMHMPFPWNAFAMFTDIERGVGKDYADGLQRLKALCEGEARKIDQATQSVQVIQWPMTQYVGFRKELPMSEMQAYFGESMGKLMAGIPKDQIAGNPASLYFVWDEANQKTDLAVVVPVKKAMTTLTTGEAVQTWPIGGNAASITFTGSYDELMYPHLALDNYLAGIGATPKEPVLEVYHNSPQTEPDATKMQTQVVYFFAPIPAPVSK
jgi:effector-binding domain-containing protein